MCDAIDNDCNDAVDDGLGVELFIDADGDGFGDDNQPYDGCMEAPGLSFEGGDCDDSDPTAHPDFGEICDGVDNNCDGSVDEGVLNTYFVDQDGDGFGDSSATVEACTRPTETAENGDDCDDTNLPFLQQPVRFVTVVSTTTAMV